MAEGAASEGILEGETQWWGAVEFLLVLMAVLGASGSLELESVEIDTPMPILNMFLYAVGACFNYMIFALKLAYSDQDAFFGGYATNVFACLVVVSNSLIGLSTGGGKIRRRDHIEVCRGVLRCRFTSVGDCRVAVTYVVNEYNRGLHRGDGRCLLLTSPSSSAPQAWPFDFPGAHAIARCAATEEGRTKLPSASMPAEVLQVVEEGGVEITETVVVATARRRVGPRRVFARRWMRSRSVAVGCGMTGLRRVSPGTGRCWGTRLLVFSFFDGIACGDLAAQCRVRRALVATR